AGERRRLVDAVDRPRAFEYELEQGHAHERRTREAHAREAPEEVGGDREGDQARDRDQLEGDAVSDEVAEEGDGQGWEREVEGGERKALVPGGRPARDT